jgi:hypothetical protein
MIIPSHEEVGSDLARCGRLAIHEKIKSIVEFENGKRIADII